jgi:hypothetical protein
MNKLLAALLVLGPFAVQAHPGHDAGSDASHLWGTIVLLAVLGLGVWSLRSRRGHRHDREDRR